jgi:hypothetical protein
MNFEIILFLILCFKNGLFRRDVSKMETSTIKTFLKRLTGSYTSFFGEDAYWDDPHADFFRRDYRFLCLTDLSMTTPFRGVCPHFEVQSFKGFLRHTRTCEHVRNRVHTEIKDYRVKGGYRTQTIRTFKTSFVVLFCLDINAQMLCGFILEKDPRGNLSFKHRFYEHTLYSHIEGLSNEIISEIITEYISKMKSIFEDAHRRDLVKAQWFDGLWTPFGCFPEDLEEELLEKQKKWEEEEEEEARWDHKRYCEELEWETDGVYPEDPYDIVDFFVEDSCLRKDGSTNRQRKKDKEQQRFQSGY